MTGFSVRICGAYSADHNTDKEIALAVRDKLAFILFRQSIRMNVLVKKYPLLMGKLHHGAIETAVRDSQFRPQFPARHKRLTLRFGLDNERFFEYLVFDACQVA